MGQTEPGPSVRPFLEAVSKQIEAIIPETASESEENFSDSDDIPSAPPTMACAGSTSQTLKSRTWRDKVSAKRKGKRRRREDTLKEDTNQQVRKQRETSDDFFYFLYFLMFCSLLFIIFLFLIFLFLLSVLFLFSLYVFYLSYT